MKKVTHTILPAILGTGLMFLLSVSGIDISYSVLNTIAVLFIFIWSIISNRERLHGFIETVWYLSDVTKYGEGRAKELAVERANKNLK